MYRYVPSLSVKSITDLILEYVRNSKCLKIVTTTIIITTVNTYMYM